MRRFIDKLWLCSGSRNVKARQRTGAMSSSDLKGREVRVREHRKVSAPTLSNASVSGEERRRRGRHEK